MERFFTLLQLTQAKVISVWGWHMFNIPEDYLVFQLCDVRELEVGECPKAGLRITVRYAKNDTRGKTRTADLDQVGGEACPVTLWRSYCQMAELCKDPRCDKVAGETTACSFCPPAFPRIYKNEGVQLEPVSSAGASKIVKTLFVSLGVYLGQGEECGKSFSGKSLRCGGVSEACTSAIRDEVVQGHGGWLQRQSLRHYDLMRPEEKGLVSETFNQRVDSFLRSWPSV